MDELLKKLLEAEVLTEDTRVELEAAFKTRLDEAAQAARAEATAIVTAELNEQWLNERDLLIEALDSKVTETMVAELDELREDIERFRDLEAEYAEKLVEAKQDMADVLKGEIGTLVEKLNSFLEIRLTSEIEELREDIDFVKKNEFGRKVFESFIEEFKSHYAGDDSIEGKLTETEQQLSDTMIALENAEKKAAKLERSIKMEAVLKPLSGQSREVMEAILKTVDTPLLEDAYSTYIGRVMKEASVQEQSEKETKVLAESKKTEEPTGRVVTGDDKARIDEQAQELEQESVSVISESEKAQLRRLAGMNK